MAYTIKEFAELNLKKLSEEDHRNRCQAAHCGDELPRDSTGPLCYYCELGELIEKYPIGRP